MCLRADDPLAGADAIPQAFVAERLRIMFDRSHHPPLYDKLIRKFDKAGIDLHPSECVSSPAELQYLVGLGLGLGLVRESATILPELTKRRIAGLDLKISTAFICLHEEARPALPLLGFRMASQCKSDANTNVPRKPPARVTEIFEDMHRLVKKA